MEVSRTSVRNAIDKLVQIGLLKQIQGLGTFVSSPETREGNPLSTAMSPDEATYLDLLEVRMGLECNAAKLAAKRASASDLLAIRQSLEEMAEDLANTDIISTSADTAFHMAVALSTKNPVLINLTRNFYDFLFVGIKKSLGHMKENEAAYQDLLEQHRAIYSHIANQDPQKAHDAMYTHICYVQNFFEKRYSIMNGIPLNNLAA
jgi:GntR family transcriptional repressor for pyruvate dehydrogenase complex